AAARRTHAARPARPRAARRIVAAPAPVAIVGAPVGAGAGAPPVHAADFTHAAGAGQGGADAPAPGAVPGIHRRRRAGLRALSVPAAGGPPAARPGAAVAVGRVA